ncbi:hypothetical protein HHI36_023414 [Cryptolaemus montrouzieri]|uniref:Uncharacterized protein n=1 Tax=Cryptolaemus montrouzieri TaxID=559131 RepID=A0ABD2PGU4_9CUCU
MTVGSFQAVGSRWKLMISPRPSGKLDHPTPEDQIADEEPSGIQTLGDRSDNSRSSSVSSSQKKKDKAFELYDNFKSSKIMDIIDIYKTALFYTGAHQKHSTLISFPVRE